MIVSDKAEPLTKLLCKDCGQSFTIEKDETSVIVGFPHFCPWCAGCDFILSAIDRYWYDLSEAYGFGRNAKGAELVQELYKLWPTQEFQRFRDFIKSVNDAENGTD